MTKEMYAAQVKNWLMDLATGVKVARKSVQFAPAEWSGSEWKVTASCYYQYEDGCAIHDLKSLAEAIDIPPQFHKFEEGEFISDEYAGYWYIDLFEVRFYGLCRKGEEENEKEFAN